MFDSIYITIATVRCLIAITSIAGNLLVCAVVMRRDMRYTVSISTIERGPGWGGGGGVANPVHLSVVSHILGHFAVGSCQLTAC